LTAFSEIFGQSLEKRLTSDKTYPTTERLLQTPKTNTNTRRYAAVAMSKFGVLVMGPAGAGKVIDPFVPKL
jgi:ATP-dependent protease Clp ATPase subunit